MKTETRPRPSWLTRWTVGVPASTHARVFHELDGRYMRSRWAGKGIRTLCGNWAMPVDLRILNHDVMRPCELCMWDAARNWHRDDFRLGVSPARRVADVR